MKLNITCLAATLLAASVCNAEGIVGCVNGESVTYQDAPCPQGAKVVPVSAPASTPAETAKPGAQPDDKTAPVPSVRTVQINRYGINSNRPELQAGMLDSHVLNNRSWGKPQHISRNRQNRAWHEYWEYTAGANIGKQLHFVNGVLADIEDKEPVPPPTRMATVTIAEGNGDPVRTQVDVPNNESPAGGIAVQYAPQR